MAVPLVEVAAAAVWEMVLTEEGEMEAEMMVEVCQVEPWVVAAG